MPDACVPQIRDATLDEERKREAQVSHSWKALPQKWVW